MLGSQVYMINGSMGEILVLLLGIVSLFVNFDKLMQVMLKGAPVLSGKDAVQSVSDSSRRGVFHHLPVVFGGRTACEWHHLRCGDPCALLFFYRMGLCLRSKIYASGLGK